MSVPASKKILLLNSEPTFGLLLQFRGFEVVSAKSYEAARDALDSCPFNLMILQIEFEREAALDFCAELKERHPALKVALLAHHTIYFPPSTCPDDVIVRQDGPGQFLKQVERLVAA